MEASASPAHGVADCQSDDFAHSLRQLEQLAKLNTTSDLALLLDAARNPATASDELLRLPGGREVLEALRRGRGPAVVAALERCATAVPPPRRKRKLESVVCCGSWEPEGAAVAWETVRVDVGGAEDVELRQCASNYFCSGCRVWDSAVALARHLAARDADVVRDRDVCELGAGVGLVARACVDLGARTVTASDREARLLGCLEANTRGRATVLALDWTEPPAALRARAGDFDVVLGADLVYSSGATRSVLDAAAALLRTRGALLLCCPDGRHGLVELFAGLRGDGRWTRVETSRVEPALLRGVEDHAFLLIRATRSDRARFPDGAACRAVSPSGGPTTPRSLPR